MVHRVDHGFIDRHPDLQTIAIGPFRHGLLEVLDQRANQSQVILKYEGQVGRNRLILDNGRSRQVL